MLCIEQRTLNGVGVTEQTAGEAKCLFVPYANRDEGRGTHLVDHSGPLVLLQPRLHLREGIEDRLGLLDLLLIVPKELQCSLKDLPCLVEHPPLLFELAPLDPHPRLRPDGDPSLVNGARPVELLVPLLELDVRLPCLVVGLPLHPALEDLARSGNVLEELLEIDVLVPELVDARQEGNGAVEEVAGVLDIAAFELDLGV